MASNIAISVTAETADLQAKFAVARAESSALTAELNKLAREAANNNSFDQLRDKMDAAAAQMLAAKNRASELGNELRTHSESMHGFGEAASFAKEALGAFGIGLGAAAIVSFGENLLHSTANIESQSRALGVSTDALQAYRAAAVQNGGSIEESDNIIRRLTRSLGDAAEMANGPARQAFEALKLTASDLAGGTEGSLPKVANALLSIEDATARARIETELFGKSGQDVERFLRAWADPNIVEAMKADGQVLDHELIERAEKFETAWATTWSRWKNDAVVAIGSVVDFFKENMAAAALAEGQAPFGKDLDNVARTSGIPFANMPAYSGPPVGGSNYSWSSASGRGATSDIGLLQPIEQTGKEFEAEARREEELQKSSLSAIEAARKQNDALTIEGIENTAREIEQQYAREVELAKSAQEAELAARRQNDSLIIQQMENDQKEFDKINQREVESRRAMLRELSSAEDTLISDILTKRQSLGRDLEQAWGKLVMAEIQGDLKWATEHALVNIGIMHSDEATAQGGLLTKAAAWAEGLHIFKTGAISQILADAKLAAANTYASVSAIPYIGPFIAPAAAVAAGAAVAAYESFDVGTNYVPRDMPAMVHQGERIIPAADNRALTEALNGGGTGGHPVNINQTFHVTAGDAKDFVSQLKTHLVGTINDAVRNGYLKMA